MGNDRRPGERRPILGVGGDHRRKLAHLDAGAVRHRFATWSSFERVEMAQFNPPVVPRYRPHARHVVPPLLFTIAMGLIPSHRQHTAAIQTSEVIVQVPNWRSTR
jgi:hypothetical protein